MNPSFSFDEIAGGTNLKISVVRSRDWLLPYSDPEISYKPKLILILMYHIRSIQYAIRQSTTTYFQFLHKIV